MNDFRDVYVIYLPSTKAKIKYFIVAKKLLTRDVKILESMGLLVKGPYPDVARAVEAGYRMLDGDFIRIPEWIYRVTLHNAAKKVLWDKSLLECKKCNKVKCKCKCK